MSYNTDFTLSYEFKSDNKEFEDFKEKCEAQGIEVPTGLKTGQSLDSLIAVLDSEGFCDYSPLMDFVGGGNDSCKWYDWRKDLKRLSEQFPDTKFTLEGKGEEQGDHWIAYFLGGKCQVCTAQITFEEFDEAKLK